MDKSPNMDQVFGLLDSLPYAYVPDDIVETIAQFPRAETLESLRQVVLTMDGELTDRAIYAMLQIDPTYGKNVLLEVWDKPSWQWFFCYSAPRYGDDSFVKPLCEILLTSADSTTRHVAAWALEHLGNVDAIEALTLALSDPGEDYEGRKISTQAGASLHAINARMKGQKCGPGSEVP